MSKTADTNINRLCKAYQKQSIFMNATLFLLGLLLMQVYGIAMLYPLIVGVVFALALELTEINVWKRVVEKSEDNLPTFFMAVSGFRFLLALVVIFIYFLLTGRDDMLVFILVFAVFYLAALIHHVLFFLKRKDA